MKRITIILCMILILTISSCAKNDTAEPAPITSKTAETIKTAEKSSVRPTVIIDPGHGFRDPGSTPEYFSGTEADVTLTASRALEKVLKSRGIPCILTHNGEKYPDESALREMAEELKIDYDPEQIIGDDKFSPYERSVYENVLSKRFPNCFFVSLHTNAVEYSPDVSGASVDWYSANPYSGRLSDFADDLSRRLSVSPGTVLKVFEDGFEDAYIVTKYADIPSVLIELGYGTNAAEAANLQDSTWINQFVTSIADAIEEYYK